MKKPLGLSMDIKRSIVKYWNNYYNFQIQSTHSLILPDLGGYWLWQSEKEKETLDNKEYSFSENEKKR